MRISIALDDIDRDNIERIVGNYGCIKKILETYSNINIPKFSVLNRDMNVDIDIIFKYTKYEADATCNVIYINSTPEYIRFYLEYYHAINESINIHNQENTNNIIEPLEILFLYYQLSMTTVITTLKYTYIMVMILRATHFRIQKIV